MKDQLAEQFARCADVLKAYAHLWTQPQANPNPVLVLLLEDMKYAVAAAAMGKDEMINVAIAKLKQYEL